MSATISGATNKAESTAKNVTNAVKEQIKPANLSTVSKTAVGMALGVPAGYAYSRLTDFVFSQFPISQEWAKLAIEIGVPFAVAGLAIYTKIPAGNLIAGTGIGTGLLVIIRKIIDLISDNTSINTSEEDVNYEPELTGNGTNLW